MNRTLSSLSKPVQICLWSALTLYAVTLPIPHTIALRNIAFVSMLVVTAFALVRCRIKPEFPFALPWAAYATVAFVSVLYAVDRDYSWRNFTAEIGYGALVFMFAATWASYKHMLGGLIAIIAMLNVTSLLLLVILNPFSELWSIYEHLGNLHPLASVGVNSNFILAAMPLIGLGAIRLWQSGRHRPLAGAMAALWLADLCPLLLSGNRQNMIALTASILCVVAFLPRSIFTRRRILVLIALMLVIASLFLLQMMRRAGLETNTIGLLKSAVQSDPRWELWRFSIEKIIEHPWQGGGFGRGIFDKLYAGYQPEDTLLWHAHNMFLNKGIQMGIPGMLAFAWLWVALFRRLIIKAKSLSPINEVAIAGLAIAVGVFMKSMTDDFFFRDPALLFWLLMGTLLGEIRRLEANAP